QIAAARRIPKNATVQLPDAAPSYVPAAAPQTTAQTSATNNGATQNGPGATVAKNDTTSQSQSVVTPTTVKEGSANSTTPADSAVPQPKATSVTAQSDNTTANTLDVATAIKNVVSPTADVTKTSDNVKQEKHVSTGQEDI